MREIKFRLRNGKIILGYQKWACKSGKGFWLYSKDQKHWTKSFPIPHAHKDSYVGLNDKNGKEIYEGDIIRGIDDGGIAIPNLVTTVTFLSGAFRDDYFHGNLSHYEFIEVIGNIYENYELLKEE